MGWLPCFCPLLRTYLHCCGVCESAVVGVIYMLVRPVIYSRGVKERNRTHPKSHGSITDGTANVRRSDLVSDRCSGETEAERNGCTASQKK